MSYDTYGVRRALRNLTLYVLLIVSMYMLLIVLIVLAEWLGLLH